MLTQKNKGLNVSTSVLTMSSSQTNLFRDELEDKFFRLKDEHQELKREANNTENQMKYLNAKLSRLINEKKRLLNKEKTRREIDLEELIYDLQQRLVQLDRENVRLREKTLVMKTQLDSEICKRSSNNAFSNIRSRTDSGLGTGFRHSRSSSALVLNRRPDSSVNVGAISHYPKQKPSTSSLPPFAYNLLEEAQQEIKKLEEVVALQQSHIESLQFQTERLRKLTNSQNTGNSNNNMENSLVNTSLTLKTSIERTNVTQTYNESNGYLQSDSDFKEKSVKKHNQLVNHQSSGKRISDEITNLIEKLQTELSIEKSKCSELRRKLLEDSTRQNGHKELEQRIQTLEKENEILKQSLEQCIGSCITEIKEKGSESHSLKDNEYERHLQMQISDLKSELLRVQNELQKERDKCQLLQTKHDSLDTLYKSVKLELEQRKDTKELDLAKECHRSDHLELSHQLQDMQNERKQLLDEFEDMKQMLKSIEESIISENN